MKTRKVGTITVNPWVLFWKLEKSNQFVGRTNFILFAADSSYWHVILLELTFCKLCSICESFLSMQLWRTILLKPFKLVTVFIHEASHAIACKLTCGHVRTPLFPLLSPFQLCTSSMVVISRRHCVSG